jgi:hypothetical protein
MSRSSTRGKRKAAVARSWGVMLIRSKGKFLGYLEAPDRAAAELAAIKAFNLTERDRKRLLVRERP